MKRAIACLAALAVALAAYGGPDSLIVLKRNSDDSGTQQVLVGPPSTPGFLTFDPTSPVFTTLDSTLTLSGGILSVTNVPVNADWNASSGLAQILNKPTIPAAQVNSDWNASSGVAQILNKPTIQAIQRTRAQTNTSGVYTWTFPSAYGAGVIPNVQITVEDGTSGAIWNQQVTAVSNTSVTVQITKTTSVSVLGINVLGIAANPQAYVHLTAIAP